MDSNTDKMIIDQYGSNFSLFNEYSPLLQGKITLYAEKSYLSESLPLRYIPEFAIKIIKHAYCMNELNPTEIRHWIDFLTKYHPDSSIEEFFSSQGEKLEIITWIWNHDGEIHQVKDYQMVFHECQFGAIYLHGSIIFLNKNHKLTEVDNCPDLVKRRLISFEHIRSRPCLTKTIFHNHCLEQENRYNELTT